MKKFMKSKKVWLVLVLTIIVGVAVQFRPKTETKVEKPKEEIVVEAVEQSKETKVETKETTVKKEEVVKKDETVKAVTKKEEKKEKTEVKKQPQVKAITKSVTPTVKTSEKKSVKKVTEKRCRLVVVKPAVYKTIQHPAKIRKEPVYKSTYGTCAFMPDGSEVRVEPIIKKLGMDGYFEWKDKNRVGATGTCTEPTTVKTGEIDVIEKEAWEEEVLVTPEVIKEICE